MRQQAKHAHYKRDMKTTASPYTPGQYVSHPNRPDWGMGQVQSAIGNRVTVNFEHMGKVLVDVTHIALEILPN